MDINKAINGLVNGDSASEGEPLFPPLSLCSVVDSRFASRRALVNRVRLSGLFETIVEPDNLGEAVGVLKDNDVDTCIVGPTVSKRACASFLKKAKAVKRASECAFVVVTSDPTADEDDPFGGDAHSLIEHSFTARLLWQEIARAVHTASTDENRNRQLDEFVDERIRRDEQTTKDVEPEKQTRTPKPQTPKQSGIVVSFLLEDNNDFRKLFQTVVGRDLTSEEAERDVGEAAVASIREIVQQVVRSKGRAKKVEHFKAYLDACVRDWFINVVNSSEYRATRKLRDQLLRYEAVAQSPEDTPGANS